MERPPRGHFFINSTSSMIDSPCRSPSNTLIDTCRSLSNRNLSRESLVSYNHPSTSQTYRTTNSVRTVMFGAYKRRSYCFCWSHGLSLSVSCRKWQGYVPLSEGICRIGALLLVALQRQRARGAPLWRRRVEGEGAPGRGRSLHRHRDRPQGHGIGGDHDCSHR